MSRISLVIVAAVMATASLAKLPGGMTIEQYVNLPDPYFNWTVAGVERQFDHSLVSIFLTSGSWLTPANSSQPIWYHWLQLCVPDVFNKTGAETAFLYIDGDNTPGSKVPPKGPLNGLIIPTCIISGTITAELTAVPNEHMTFPQDPLHQSRTEDAIIAYTWAHFLNNTVDGKPLNTEWLLRYPMTRAAVRAMDAIQAYSATIGRGYPIVDKFLVAGASKRGWTTWTTASVDPRVVAAVPIVAPIGGIVGSINLHWQAYGEWSFALSDYLEEHLFDFVNAPEFEMILDYVGIDTIYNKLKMPKLVIGTCGDEFFIPDSPRFFWDDLQGEKLLRWIPNAEHSCAGHAEDIMAGIQAFYVSIVSGYARPTVSWNISDVDGSIEVFSEGVPVEKAVLWKATNAKGRDFRLIVCGDVNNASCLNPVFWFPEEIQPVSPGRYVASVPPPADGWSGFLVELHYKIGGLSYIDPFKVTTPVSVVPLNLPYAPCGASCSKRPPVPAPNMPGSPLEKAHAERVENGMTISQLIAKERFIRENKSRKMNKDN